LRSLPSVADSLALSRCDFFKSRFTPLTLLGH
jgi:hypothetical protein